MKLHLIFLCCLITALHIPLTSIRKNKLRNRRQLTQTNVPLWNEVRRLYVGPLVIGTTTFNVTFDTGSSNLWVFGAEGNCQTPCGGSEGCVAESTCCTASYMHTYKKTKTFEDSGKTFDIRYGRGWVSGTSGVDNVALGGKSVRYKFGIATDWHPGLVDCFEKMDGILGLSFRKYNHVDNLIYIMEKEGLIPAAVWSFYLKPGKEMFIFGEPVSDYYKEMIYINILHDQRGWVIPVRGVGLSDNIDGTNTTILKNCYPSCTALLDSGTSYIILPISTYNDFMSSVMSVRSDCISIEGIPDNGIACDANIGLKDLPSFWLNMGGKQFIITPEDYSIKECWEQRFFTETITECSLTLSIGGSKTAGKSLYILGDVFIRKYYTVFDQTRSKIGLGSMETLNNAVITTQHGTSKKDNTLAILIYILIPIFSFLCCLIYAIFYVSVDHSHHEIHVNQLCTMSCQIDETNLIEDLDSESV